MKYLKNYFLENIFINVLMNKKNEWIGERMKKFEV